MNMLASISSEVRIHSWPDGNLNNVYKPATHIYNGTINSMSWAKDGGWMIVVPKIGSAEIVSFGEKARLLHCITGIENPTCASFPNATKRNIALGTEKGQIQIYDVKLKTIKKEYPVAPCNFFKVEYCAKDTHIIAGCENNEIFIYNNGNKCVSGSFSVPNSGAITNFRCHPTKKLIGACSEIGVVTVWDMFASKFITHTQLHNNIVSDMAFSKGRDDCFVSVGLDCRVCFYDMSTKTLTSDLIVNSPPTAVDFCNDGYGIAVGFQDGRISAYDTRYLKEHLSNFTGHKSQVNDIMFEKSIELIQSNPSIPDEYADYLDTDEYAPSMSTQSRMFCGDYLPDIPEVDNEFSSNESIIDSYNQDKLDTNPSSIISLGITDGVKKLMDSKPNLLGNPTSTEKINVSNSPSASAMVDKRLIDNTLKNYIDNFMQCQIIPNNEKPKTADIDMKELKKEIRKVICDEMNKNKISIDEALKDNIKEIVKEQLEEFGKTNVYYQFVEIMSCVRRHFLDLQMFLVKEFIRSEEYMLKVKEEVTNTNNITSYDGYVSESAVIQENIKLRDEISYLKEKLSTDGC